MLALQLGGHSGVVRHGERLDALGIAAFAQDMIVQRITTDATFRLGGQQLTAIFALITRHVEATIESHDADCFVLARFRHDGQLADAAAWSKLFVEIFDAVDLVGRIDGERNSVEGFATYDAREALRMVGFSGGSEDAFENRLQTDGALFERVEIVFLAVGFPVQSVEWLALQIYLTLLASEASNVEDLVHGRAAGIFSDNAFAALDARAKVIGEEFVKRIGILHIVHGLDKQVGQLVNFVLLRNMLTVLLLGQHGIIGTVDATGIYVRSVQRIVGPSGHLAGGTWINRFVDRFVR